MAYRVSSHGQTIPVIAAGGHPKITEEKLGDSLSAFALP
jgi:glucose dehydrogenase